MNATLFTNRYVIRPRDKTIYFILKQKGESIYISLRWLHKMPLPSRVDTSYTPSAKVV